MGGKEAEESDTNQPQADEIQRQLSEVVMNECGKVSPIDFCSEMGINTMDDLKYVTEDSLKEISMKPIMRRKMVALINHLGYRRGSEDEDDQGSRDESLASKASV